MIISRNFFRNTLIDFPEKVTLTDTLNVQSKRLTTIAGLYTLSSSLSSIFVIVYLFKINSDVTTPLLFYLGIYISLIVSFILSGYLLQRLKIGVLFCIGFLIETLFYIGIVILGEQSINYVFLLGLFFGVGEGMFWLSRHVIEYIYSTDRTRNKLFSAIMIVDTLAVIIGPILAGLLISSGKIQNFSGYLIVFSAVAALFFLAGIISLKFSLSKKFEFNLLETFTLHKKNHSWRSVEISETLHGLRMGSGMVLINLIAYLILKDEFGVGGAATLGAAVSLLIGYLIGKFASVDKRESIAWIGSIIPSIAYAVLVYYFNETSLFAYIILMGISAPMLFVTVASLSNKAIDNDENYGREKIVTYKVSNEIWWNLGRISSVAIFLILLQFIDLYNATKYFLLLSTIVFPLMMFTYKKYNLFLPKK